MRVASSDWCASRMVVSVIRTCFWSFIQAANFSGPSWSRRCLVPGTGVLAESRGLAACAASAGGKVRPRVSGWPFTVTSAI